MQIKLNKVKRVIFGLAVFAALFLYSSCEIGLGESVDTEAPKGDISSPGVDAIIRGVFAMQGTWTDDGSVSSVSITLKNTSTETKTEYSATIEEGKWYCEIDPDDEAQPIVDGSYLATVVLKDDGGHTTTYTSSYTIDNTPPLIVLQRPSTKSNAASADVFGQTFTLKGQAVDDNDVSKILVKVYSDQDCTNLLKSIELSNVPANMEMDVATYEAGNTSNDYYQIYGDYDETKKETKTFYCKLEAYDGAAYYPLKDSEASSDGNCATSYYLYSDISTLISSYKSTGIYKMQNGTYDGETDTIEAVKAKLSANEISVSKFSLNPDNSPTFTVEGTAKLVSGESLLTSTGALSTSCSITNKSKELIVTISPGRDEISINADDEEKPLSVYLMECDDSGNITGSEKIPLITTYLNSTGTEWILVEGQGSVTVSDSSYVITTGTISTENYNIETYNSTTKKLYRVCVSAYDDNDLKAVEYNSKIYAFGLSSSASIIETTVSSSPEYVSVNEAANADNKILKVSLTYTYDGKAYLLRTIGSKDSEKILYDDTKADDENYQFPAGTDVSFTDKIQVDDLKQSDGTYASTVIYQFVSILGEDVAASNEKTVNVKYDNEVPIAGSVSVPSTSETALSSFSFSGSVSDAASGIDKVYIRITDNTDSTKTTGDLAASGSDSWIYKFSAAELPEGGAFDEEGYKTVLIWALDKVGLSTILYSSNSWIYDTSAPEFTIDSYISADSDGNYSGSSLSITTSTSGSASFNTGKAFKLIGSASDNFGIKQISVIQSDGTNTLTLDSDTDGGIVYNSTDGSWYIEDLPRDSSGSGVSLPDVGSLATYTYTFSIKDYGDSYATAKTLSVVIDREAPVITITAPDSADSSTATVTPDYSAFGEGSLSGDAATFRGSVSDGDGLGMQYYSYVITESSTAPAKDEVDSDGNSIWTQKSKTSSGSWSFSLPLGSGTSGTESETVYEGSHYLYVYAVDQANNESEIISVPFCVDQNAPTIAVLMETKKSDTESESDSENSYTALGSLSSYDISDADLFRFLVYASDTNGISSVSAVNSVDNTEFTLTKTDDSNIWTSDDISTEGSYTIVISVEDISGIGLSGESALSGRKTTVTKTVVFDKTAPTIDSVKINNTDITSATDNSSNWYSSNTVTVIVTASDNASGVSAVQYSTDNTKWQDFLISSGTYRANVEFEDDGEHKLYLRAVDVIGNESSVFQTVDSEGTAIDGIVIKIDSSAPELESLWYKTGDVTAEASGTVYISGIETKDLTVYGTISDDDSGLSGLTFTMNGNEVSPSELYYSSTESTVNDSGENTKTWITTAEAASSVAEGAFAALTDFDDSTDVKSWKATFAASSIVSGKFVATGSNGAGGSYALPAFTISVDSKKPSLANISMATSNSAYSVYQPDSSFYTYYLNNENQTFTISGIVTDDKGVSKVAISVESYTEALSTTGEWTFTGIDLSSVSGDSTTAIITAYDLAGNAQTQTLTINIDKTAPQAKHWADKNDKDIYFRIGNANNTKVLSAAKASGYANEADENWDSDLDEDVGGKYSAGTYGNSSTIEIRGYFEEASSGLKMIYYKIFSTAPTAEEIEELVTGYKALPNYFSPLSSEKTRRVIYTDSSNAKKSISIPSNFDATISGFDNDNNYLVLLAVDNVGNVTADTLSGYSVNQSATESDATSKWNGTDSSSGNGLEYYSINVDTVVPEISDSVYSNKSTKDDKSLDGTVYSNKKEKSGNYIKLYGLATDSASGIENIVFTVNGNTISNSDSTYGSMTLTQSGSKTLGGTEYTLSEKQSYWEVEINPSAFENVTSGSISIYAKVTDKADTGNSNTVSVATVTIDEKAPTVTLDTPTDAASDIDGTQINGTINLTGTVDDANTLPSSSVTAVQYSTDKTNWTDVTTELMEDFAASGSYSYKVSGFDTTTVDDGTYYLRVAANDVAGNTGYSNIVTVKVLQDSDRPLVTFTNLEIGSENTSGQISYMSSSNYVWLKNTTTLTGIVTDDDGISSAFYSTDNSSWTELSLNNSSWSITLSEGSSVVYFKITDTAGSTFTSEISPSSALTTPKLSDGTYAISGGIPVYLKVDKTSPVTRNIKYAYYDESLATPAYTALSSELESVGGKRTKVQLNFDAGDENDIESVELSITVTENESTSTASYSGSQQDDSSKESDRKYYSNWTVTDIDVSSLSSGNHYATLTVTDKAGLIKTDSIVLSVDNTPSTVNVKSPSSSTSVSGEVSAYGTLTENATLYYSVSPAGQDPDSITSVSAWYDGDGNSKNMTSVSVDGWTQVEDASLSWTVNFNNADNTSSGTNAKSLNKYIIDYGIASKDETSSATDAIVSSFETIVKLYLHLKSVDAVGNEYITSYPIMVDPQGDRPTVAFSYPSSNTVTLGGTVSIYGTATDTVGSSDSTIGVDSVWVQIKSTTHRAAENTSTYGTSPSYDETSDSISMTLTTADLDYMASNGYSVYKMSSYDVDGTNTAWTSGSSSLSSGESASDYAAIATLSGAAWTFDINKTVSDNLYEFDPPSGVSSNPVAIRIFARDLDGKFSQKADRYVSFDADTPVISDLYLVQSSDGKIATASTASKAYSQDMYVKDSWYLTGTATDKDKIAILKIGDTELVKNSTIVAAYSDCVTLSSDGTTVQFKYPLETGSGVGALSFTVSATDAATGKSHTGSENISIKYDNTAPEIAASTNTDAFNISSDICQSNSWYTFGSKAYEPAVGSVSQSGFAYTAFFFQRTYTTSDGSVNNIYDILQAKASAKVEFGTETIPALGEEASTASENSIVNDSGLYWYKKTISDISGNTFTVSDSTGIRVNALMKIDGALYLITAVNGTSVTVGDSLSDGIECGYVAIAGIVDNTTPESAPSVGDIQEDGYYDNPNRDDGDRMIESVDKSGTTWTWEANVCSRNIADGPVILHYVVFDKAGNYTASSVSGTVSNNKPRIAGAIVKTDYNGNGSVADDGETVDTYSAEKSYAEYYTGTTSSGAYIYDPDSKVKNTNAKNPLPTSITYGEESSPVAALRGYTLIQPEIVGGNGALYYSYKVTNGENVTSGSNSTAFIEEGSTDYTAVTGSINVQLGDLLAFGDTTNSSTGIPFVFTIWDSTEGLSAFTSSQKATLTMYFAIQAATVGTPTASITPFYWNSLTDNSIYASSDAESYSDLKGHIELENDWKNASGYDSNTSETQYDADPKVSGKITIAGVASDTKLIAKLTASVFGTSYEVATYSSSTGLLASNYVESAFTTNGFWFEIVSQTVDSDGHDVSWNLHIDTASTVINSDVAAIDKIVTMTATNRGKPTVSTESGTLTSIDGTTKYVSEATYDTGNSNTPGTDQTTSSTKTAFYRMDIVPYITKVYTKLAKQKKSNWSVYNRTALGHYPVQSVVSNIDSSISLNTTTSEDVVLYGFNLNDSSATITSGSNTFTVGNETEVLKITSDSDSGTLTFNVANLASGQLNLSVNDLQVLNNVNNNDAKGGASTSGSAYVNCYNRQANGDTNNILTDDIEFDVWEFNDRASEPLNGLMTGINMEINQSTKMLNYAATNGGLYYNMGGKVSGADYSSYYWAGDWDTFAGPCVGFHVDDLGNTYSVCSGGDTNNSGHVDKYAFWTSRWGLGTHGTGGTYGGSNALRLEHIALKTGSDTYDYSLMKYRFLSSEFASTVSGTSTNLYMVYYDALCNQIRFRAGTFTSSSKESTGGFNDQATNQTPDYYNTTNCQVIANGASGSTFTVSNGTTTVSGISGRGAGQYVDVAVVKNDSSKDVVCVVWYDGEDNCLKYSYITDPISSWSSLKGDVTAANWSTPKTIFSEGGEYCHIVADKNNHLHIAAYAGNGDVMYAYLDSYFGKASTCSVDASGAVGEHLTLDVAVNSSNHSIPYIGYYTSAIKMPKYAYLVDDGSSFNQVGDGVDDNERFTGKWEVSVVPSPSHMTTNREDKVNIGVWKSSGVLTDSKVNDSVQNCSIKNTLSAYDSTNWSKTYGNGTSNGILGYQISTSTGSCLETAQMR